MSEGATQFRWVGDHPREFTVTKDEGTTYPFLAPGDFIDLDSTTLDDELKELVDTNQLYDVEAFNKAAAEQEAEAAAQAKAAEEAAEQAKADADAEAEAAKAAEEAATGDTVTDEPAAKTSTAKGGKA
jgi:FKBP-type peptidyl-prolyl cis-trans isomerase